MLFRSELLLLEKKECVRRVINRQNTDPNSHYIEDAKKIVEIYSSILKRDYPTLEEGFDELNIYRDGVLIKS